MSTVRDLSWKTFLIFFACCWVCCNTGADGDNSGSGESAFIIDHNCTDLAQIPAQWISSAKQELRIHYAHTSHGSQIAEGLRQLAGMDGSLCFSSSDCHIPAATNCLRILNGQFVVYDGYCETYVTPDLYWQEDYGMDMTRWMLSHHNIDVSIWAWCSQLDYYSETEVRMYLDRIASLQEEFPDVVFVFMTGNAQSQENNRYSRNNQIREYCRNNRMYLFDFADLDCWYNGEQHLSGGIPMEHPRYYGDEAGHTTFESCRNKAKAFWWLVARIAGWQGT
jgi:hypothetical protein